MESATKYSFIFLAALLLFPSAVKLGHVFSSHEHTYCNHYADSHFHQENWDCELFEFHQASFTSLEVFRYEAISPALEKCRPTSVYNFLSDYQKLPFALRGPPSLL